MVRRVTLARFRNAYLMFKESTEIIKILEEYSISNKIYKIDSAHGVEET